MTGTLRLFGVALCCVVVAAVIPAHEAGAQDSVAPCNPRLTPQQGELGYKLREKDRCEGVYERLVALGSLRPISLIHAEQPVPPNSYQISWPDAAGRGPVTIQAVSFKEGVLYRMDAVGRGGSFPWKTEVLNRLRLRQGDFGVLATTTGEVGGEHDQRIYVPVTLSTSELATTKNVPRGSYDLRVASVEDLADVFLTVRGPVRGKETPPTVVADKAVLRAYYSAAEPMRIQLDLPAKPGIYEVRIAGTRKSRPGSTMTTFFIRHD
jgi:hypothetical protein